MFFETTKICTFAQALKNSKNFAVSLRRQPLNLIAMKKITIFFAILMSVSSLMAQEWEVTVEELYYGDLMSMAAVDGGEYVLGVGLTYFSGSQDGLVVKVAKDGSYISRTVHMPGMILRYHCAEQLPNGNYMAFGICNDSLMDPDFQRYFRVDVFDTQLEMVSSKVYDVNDDVFECFVRPNLGQVMKSIVSKSGTVILTARLSYLENASYPYYVGAFRFYEFDEEGNIIRYVDDSPNLVLSGSIKEITYAPHSDNLMVILKGGVYPEGHLGCCGLFVFDTAFHVVARQHMLGLASPLGLVSDNACDGTWIDGEYLVLDIEKRWNNDNPHRSLFKVDSALRVYAELDLLPLDDSCTQTPSTTTAYINDTTIFEFSYSRLSMFDFTTQQVNINLVDKNLNLMGRKVIRQDGRYNQVQSPAAFNDGGCLIWFFTIDNSGGKVIENKLMKFRREDIEITWDVVKEERVDRGCAYPNPATHTVNIPIGDKVCESGRLQVFDIKGAKCLDSAITKQGNLITMDIQNLEAGMYVYKIVLRNQETISGKFVKE